MDRDDSEQSLVKAFESSDDAQLQWSEDIPLALEPGETEKRQIATETEFVAGNTVSITISDTDQKAAFAKLLNPSVGAERVPNAVSVAPTASDGAAVVH